MRRILFSDRCPVAAGLACGWIFSALAAPAATFVSGLVPDWNQPNWHGANQSLPNPMNGGPVGDPNFDAWCVPTSAANLVGHWEDVRGEAISDGATAPASGASWGAGPAYQDYQANGAGTRGSLSPGTPDGLGWYLNTNGLGSLGGSHVGTRYGQISTSGVGGLNQFFSDFSRLDFSAFTRGTGYADPGQILHADATSGYLELRAQVNANRTAIAHFSHWNLLLSQAGSVLVSATAEADFGWDYYTFDTFSGTGPDDLSAEIYNNETGADGIGHAVTVVGYIDAGSADDISAGSNTNWVIVHDNSSGTARNVAVPMGADWRANTIVIPEPASGVLGMLAAGWACLRRRRRPC